ncbi:hypothetical protein [Actinomadura yumaensis]
MDAIRHLGNLRSELIGRKWRAEIRTRPNGDVLHVQNPAFARMDGEIVCKDDAFHWVWGPVIGPVTAVTGVADRIVYVLREVGS